MDTVILYKPNTLHKQVEIHSDDLERIIEYEQGQVQVIFKRKSVWESLASKLTSIPVIALVLEYISRWFPRIFSIFR